MASRRLGDPRVEDDGAVVVVRPPAANTLVTSIGCAFGAVVWSAAIGDGDVGGLLFLALWSAGVVGALVASVQPAVRADAEGLTIGLRRTRVPWGDVRSVGVVEPTMMTQAVRSLQVRRHSSDPVCISLMCYFGKGPTFGELAEIAHILTSAATRAGGPPIDILTHDPQVRRFLSGLRRR